MDKKEKYYLVNLYDCATPAFISSTKEYYGRIADIEELARRAEGLKNLSLKEPLEKLKQGVIEEYYAGQIKVKFAVPVSCITKKEILCTAFRYEFTNIWSFPYVIDIDEMSGEIAVVSAMGKYVVCYKVRLKNARIVNRVVDRDLPPLYIDNNFWGYPGMLRCEKIGGDKYTSNALYMPESVFDTKESAMERLDSDKPLDLKAFCDDIFGDG